MTGAGRFLSGAAVLTGAVGVSKVLGALYKIPLGNALGAAGMAHFYGAYNVYNVLLLLSTSGLPAAVCRLTSQAVSKQHYRTARHTFSAALVLFSLLGLAGSLTMFFFPQAAARLLHDDKTSLLIRVLSPSVACVCIIAAIRGYTQGLGRMMPTALSQIIESAAKLTVGIGLCLLLLHRGYPAHVGAAGAVAGVSAGSVLALVYLWNVQRRTELPRSSDRPPSHRKLWGKLITVALPVTLGSMGMSVLTLLDQSLTLHALHRLGYESGAALALYGTYTFALTLFALPGSFIMPISSSLLPSLAGAAARGRTGEVTALTQQALRLTSTAVFPMGIGMSLLAEPILLLLYPAAQEAPLAAPHLAVLGIASVFVGFYIICSGILLSVGREKLSLLTLLAGGAVKVVSNVLLCSQPTIHVYGAPWSTLLCYGVIAALHLLALHRIMPEISLLRILSPASLSALVMAMAVRPCYLLLNQRLLPTVALCALIYAALCFALDACNLQEFISLKKRSLHHDTIPQKENLHL